MSFCATSLGLPWEAVETDIRNSEGDRIADFWGPDNGRPHAAYAVRAVNAHAIFLASLRDMMPDAIEEAKSGRIILTPAMEAACKLLAELGE